MCTCGIPNLRTVGYELLFSGIEITTVENLADPGDYPVTPQASFGGQRVISVSYVDSSIARSTTFQPAVRVYFTNPQSVICIAEVVDVVNETYTNSTTALQDACILSTGLAAPLAAAGVRALPNPFVESTVVTFHQASSGAAAVELLDLQGRVVRSYAGVKGGRLVIRTWRPRAGHLLCSHYWCCFPCWQAGGGVGLAVSFILVC